MCLLHARTCERCRAPLAVACERQPHFLASGRAWSTQRCYSGTALKLARAARKRSSCISREPTSDVISWSVLMLRDWIPQILRSVAWLSSCNCSAAARISYLQHTHRCSGRLRARTHCTLCPGAARVQSSRTEPNWQRYDCNAKRTLACVCVGPGQHRRGGRSHRAWPPGHLCLFQSSTRTKALRACVQGLADSAGEVAAAVRDHPATSAEVHALCTDLQVRRPCSFFALASGSSHHLRRGPRTLRQPAGVARCKRGRKETQ
jgi:hypothetical protein